ncbi:hypothetical protein A2803_05525 [Candidatus Woesebacteria bacterium RIFCSPHIGHO2_01_FULL_44_21]|uniref:Probable membrane transporter protein n=1 Tax=Candidatus Woesebacteria bacterium RIFCSPHIGHO2_01_FULL_44_21 TaxID=1802503 RepID=A0A1F7Z168_9BACT|nr:MAG: hypothetical protein A2803_05525 [Candidatus Woesebacteria bacterium RIFCSPHIGHO2_01_FULL_44_21]OGM71022.1 MAG: hypothetical protein A2897_03460 [Candidatus Woesebacteria bacterium RIFCSPLOWO2_01_FULL_44_24b]
MDLILLSALTLIASIVGTLAGFGTSTIMLPILLLFIPYPVALLFVGIIHFFDDLWEIILFKRAANWKLLLGFGVPGIMASFAGARLVVTEPSAVLSRLLGALIIFYVLLVLAKPKLKIPANTISAGVGGTLSGLIAGIFGIGGPVRAMFLTAFNLPKETYLFTSGAIALFIDPARLATYILGGTKLPQNLLWGLLIFIPITFIGSWAAKKFVSKIPQDNFRKVVALFLLFVGVRLLVF